MKAVRPSSDKVYVQKVHACRRPLGGRQSEHLLTRPRCALQVGEITSGAFSPCLKKNIAMGYVEKPFAKSGTQLKVRGGRLSVGL